MSRRSVSINPRTLARSILYNDSGLKEIKDYMVSTKGDRGAYPMTNRRFTGSLASSSLTRALSYRNTYRSATQNETRRARKNVHNMKMAFGNKYADALVALDEARADYEPMLLAAQRAYSDGLRSIEQKSRHMFGSKVLELKNACRQHLYDLEKTLTKGLINGSDYTAKKAAIQRISEKAISDVLLAAKKFVAAETALVEASYNAAASRALEVRDRHFAAM